MIIDEYYVEDNLMCLDKISSESIDLTYIDPPFATGRNFHNFNDKWADVGDFVNSFMKPRLEKIYKATKKSGTLVIHVDLCAVHYLKVLLDSIFDYSNFRNEIIWMTTGNRKSKKKFQRTHDVLLVYSKSKNYTFNPIYLPYGKEYKLKNNVKKDERGEYVTTAAHNSQPNVIKREKLRYVWNGHSKQWWWSKDRMQRLHNENRLKYNNDGIPRIKRYLSEMPGVPIRDVWTDISSIQKPEKIDYATQKPIKLLERIIFAYTNEDNLVLDCFAGSGTTGVACINLQRHYILIDKNEDGLNFFKHRLNSEI